MEGHLEVRDRALWLHPTDPGGETCLQLVRPVLMQSRPLPAGRVRVEGRMGVFGDPLRLARLEVGQDQANYEVCDGRFLIVDVLSPVN